MTALEELSHADARVKDVTRDQAELSRMVDEAKIELTAIEARIASMTGKLTGLNEQLLEAKKLVDQKNKSITNMGESDKVALAAYEKQRDELQTKIEGLKKGAAVAAPTAKVSVFHASNRFPSSY
ncbi:hypothetical protein EJ08DRAFT_29946 [Tothia fuscella]|uniref:Uncharacterized protein n=1 Tax=Tothia fuscella TaxID=1048955 RepID=A0A9P4NGL4_9PEZI|nr:hypothetical protein EJ08DRAFT_29946 [Tothia fuscella]